MLRWFLLRCCWMVPSLIGITLVTFLVLDMAPVDRAAMELASRQEQVSVVDVRENQLALARLRLRYGMVDPETLEPVPVWSRYGTWLWNALQLRFHGVDEDPAMFRRRIFDALMVSLLVGFWALVVAVSIGAPVGSWLGTRIGTPTDRVATTVMLTLSGLPEVLVATLLVLWFGGPVFDLLPTAGLRSDDSEQLSVLGQLFDLASHLMMPVLVMAIGPTLLLVRFLRESVGRAANSAFVQNLDAWGVDAGTRRRRLLRVGFAPVATLAGTLLPLMITGSIVVETVFSIDGIGRLAWNSVRSQDQAMVMAVTLIASTATLFSLVLSDLLHRVTDPRVRLDA